MARGGARNRSGPQKDPKSGRSDRAKVVFTALPFDGYDGPVPEYPLPKPKVYDEDGVAVEDQSIEDRWERELEVWAWAWSTPQAAAWSVEPWRWQAVGMWVRTTVVCEGAGATAADKGSVHRFADQIGLTPAGLKENGWAIASPAHLKDAAESDVDPADEEAAAEAAADPRLRLVKGSSAS